MLNTFAKFIECRRNRYHSGDLSVYFWNGIILPGSIHAI